MRAPTWIAAATTALALLPGSAPFVSAQNAGGQAPQPAFRTVTVGAIPGVIAAGATWQRAWQGTDNADGLVATSDGGILFAQEQPNRVSKLLPDDSVSAVIEDTHGAGALAMDAAGRILAVQRTCTDPGRRDPCAEPTRIGIIFPERERRTLAESAAGQPLGRLNDLVVSTSGTVYFTSGGAFALRRDGMAAPIGENLRTNGVMLSPDEKTLYVTNGATLVAFDVAADGSVGRQRNFATLQAGGSGDGLAVDGAGRLYVTSAPGVQVFSAAGAYLGVIPTPRAVISVAFAGPGKQTLYVVGSGAADADGREITTPAGVRNNAKTIFRIRMLTPGFSGRAK